MNARAVFHLPTPPETVSFLQKALVTALFLLAWIAVFVFL